MFFLNYINKLVASTPPPANDAYGFKWQAGQGVPNQLAGYDLATAVAPGIYVAFPPTLLDSAIYDPFGRLPGGPGTVFPILAGPSAAMTNLITRMRSNPPAGQAALFNNATPARLADLTGFLSYTNTCLEIINATAAGAQLLQRITTGRYAVFITPTSTGGGNQTFAGGNDYLNTFTTTIMDYNSNAVIPGAAITEMVNTRYATIRGMGAKFNQFATDLNALALVSLFVNQAAFQPNFLYGYFRFRNQRLTGQNLMNWLSTGGFTAFDRNLRTFDRVYQGVLVRDFFLLAMSIVLYPNVPAGTGTGAGIKFNVLNAGDNVLGSPNFRPPAIGLAHELMHAMHYSYGTASGYDFGHFTTTAAEALFVGLGPFATQPITENAIRNQYGGIPPATIDPSNVWAAPAQRNTYELPVPPQTATTMRAALHCI